MIWARAIFCLTSAAERTQRESHRRHGFGTFAAVAVAIAVSLLSLSALPGQTPPPDDGQWTMPAKDLQGTRYSGLDQINSTNAKNLKVAWTFSTGVNKGQEAAPLVVGDTMYVVTPFPNYLYALDLRNNGATKWKYDPKPASSAQGVACCDVVNRLRFFQRKHLFQHTR